MHEPGCSSSSVGFARIGSCLRFQVVERAFYGVTVREALGTREKRAVSVCGLSLACHVGTIH